MDLAYLRTRLDVSRDSAAHAASGPARRAHAALADLYADRIAQAERGSAASSVTAPGRTG